MKRIGKKIFVWGILPFLSAAAIAVIIGGVILLWVGTGNLAEPIYRNLGVPEQDVRNMRLMTPFFLIITYLLGWVGIFAVRAIQQEKRYRRRVREETIAFDNRLRGHVKEAS